MKGFLGCSECLIDTTTWPCLVGLLNLLLLLQKPKANQRAQKATTAFTQSNFYCSTKLKAPLPLLSATFEVKKLSTCHWL
jgi:hypothetical protein